MITKNTVTKTCSVLRGDLLVKPIGNSEEYLFCD